MTSLQRSVVSSSPSLLAPVVLWRVLLALLALVGVLVAKAVDYEMGTVAGYFAYVALYVALPGTVAMYAVNRGPLSVAKAFALGLPTGFALEIFTFLGCAALGWKSLYAWTPLGWVALAIAIRRWRDEWPVAVRVRGNHAGVCVGLGLAFLGTAVMAASQMFAEAPLAQGLPTRAIFHDWVYLVSRAGVIKNLWPLSDPSLSGTPLQYHYFMMVHAAAVSWTTDIEITTVMLRLIFVPLGAVMVAQTYLLGRMVSGSAWGGVLAAWLTVAASELSFAPSYSDPMFLGLFVRWLFVSPTFFFGLIFCGALLLAIAECARAAHCSARQYGWLLLLGTAGTGAKGTVLPVLICALALWTLWRWGRECRLSPRLIAFGVCLGAAFAMVYVPTMSGWRTGDAAWRPFHVFQLTAFWKLHLPAWTQWLAQWMPRSTAGTLASLACAAVVFAGTCGVRLLALPYLVWGDESRDRLVVSWLGAFFVAAAGMGMLMELNSYGELYVILMMRLPMAALAAGFCVAAVRRIGRWLHQLQSEPAAASRSPFALQPSALLHARPTAFWLPRLIVIGGTLVLLVAFGLQTSLWWTRNRAGLGEWWRTPMDVKPDSSMQELREALLWVRENTEPNAVLVANAFTPENMKKDHWGALDRTLMGVHFYYSAFSERRLWFEGPNYILDTTRARIRANLASNFFYRGRPLDRHLVNDGPCYVLIDRSLGDGARAGFAADKRVFSNTRMEIYRLADPMTGD